MEIPITYSRSSGWYPAPSPAVSDHYPKAALPGWWYHFYILFHEYFHGDNGAGLGASHQTGWTGLVARLFQFYGSFSDFETAFKTGGLYEEELGSG